MLVPRFFPRKGPNGTYSHFWMSRAVMKEGEEFIDLQHLISTELWHESMKFTGMTDNESVKGANLCTYHSSHSSEPCQRCDPLPCPCWLALPAGCRGRLGMPSPAQSQIICKDQTLVAELQQIRKNTIMKTLLHVMILRCVYHYGTCILVNFCLYCNPKTGLQKCLDIRY